MEAQSGFTIDVKGARVKRLQHDPDSRYPGPNLDEGMDDTQHPLDDAGARALLSKLQEWWDQARQYQADNRLQQSMDHDFYDGLQWQEDDIQEVEGRNQAPYVFNIVKPAVDWIIGTEKRTKMDYRIYPRVDSPEARKDAEIKTKVYKYLDDVNMVQFHRSRAFAEAVKAGVGWLEDGARNDERDETIYSGTESWRNIWYDGLSTDPALDDARYLFRGKWLDTDYLVAMFPDRAVEIRQAVQVQTSIGGDPESDDFWYARMLGESSGSNIIRRGWVDEQGGQFNRRSRARAIECWYRMPAKRKKMRGFDQTLNGMVFDQRNPTHQKAKDEEIISLYDAIVRDMWVAIFVDGHLLQNMRSPYRHNDFPFTPIWAYRRGRDNAPYGPIRNARDPQEDFNKRASKAQFILSTNQILAEENAVEDGKWEEVVSESSRPDGVIKLRNGALQNKKFQIVRDKELAEEHLLLMDRDQALVRDVSGVQGENLGADTNAISGKAIVAKQNEGSVVTFELYENLRFARLLQGRKRMSLVEQFMDLPKTLRVSGERPGKEAEYLNVNEPEWDPIEGKWVFKNDLTRFQADFVIDEQDFRVTIRAAMFDQLSEMLAKLSPDVALQLLDVVFDMSDHPEKEELVNRIRKVNGQTDPNKEETPEEMEARELREQKEQKDEQLRIRELLSVIEEREAQTEKLRADTRKANMEFQQNAVEAAGQLAVEPALADTADALMESAEALEGEGEAPQMPQAPQIATPPSAPIRQEEIQ